MNLFVLVAITIFNSAVVTGLIVSPATFAWLSPGDAVAIAAVQALVVYIVFRKYQMTHSSLFLYVQCG